MTFIKSYFTLLLLVFSSFLLNAQSSEIELATISSKWNTGKYQLFVVYDENGGLTMRGGKVDVEIDKDGDGLISTIKYKIENITYEFTPIFWGGSGGPLIGFKHGRNQYLYVTETGIAHYTMMGSKMDELNYMLGTKLGGSKKVKKIIMEYREGLESISKQRDEDRKNAIAEHRNKYSIKDKKVKEIKVNLKSDDAKIDCSSKFVIEYTAILEDGTAIKSKSQGGEAYSSDYKFRVVGADGKSLKDKDGKKLAYSEYTVHKYCDNMDDKHLLVEVSSKYNPDLYGTVRIATSCVPDPAIIEQNKRDEERRKEQELLAAKKAEQDNEEKRLLAEQQKKAAARAKSLASSLSNGKVVGNGNGIGLLIFETNVKGDNTNPKGLVSRNFKTIKGKVHGFGSNAEGPAVNTYYKGKIVSKGVKGNSRGKMVDGDLDAAGNVYYICQNKIYFGKNAGANYTENEGISSEELFDQSDIELCAIAAIGENKCLAFGYTKKDNYNYIKERKFDRNNRRKHYDKLYLVIWDRVTGKKMVREYLENYTCGIPKVMKSYDGNVIVSYQDLRRYIWKLDALASFKTGEIKTIWKKELPSAENRVVSNTSGYGVQPIHMFEDKDKNIVITYVDDYKIMCFQKVSQDFNNMDNRYCSNTGIGRIDKNGALYQESFFPGYNLSKWGGSHEYALKNTSYPGQMLMSDKNFPVATQHPLTGDYIMVNTGEGFQIEYPMDFTRLPSKDYAGNPVARGHSTEPNVVIINSVDMSLQTFDLVETDVKFPVEDKTSYYYDGYADFAGKTNRVGITMVEYDKTKEEIILYHHNSKVVYRVKPSFLLQWAPGADQDVSPSSTNKLGQKLVAASSSASNKPRESSSSSSSSSSGSSSSSSSSKSNSSSSSSSSKPQKPKYQGKIVVKNDTRTKYHVWNKNGQASLNPNSSTPIRCENYQKIYISTTTRTSDKILILEVKPEHCGSTIKISDYL